MEAAQLAKRACVLSHTDVPSAAASSVKCPTENEAASFGAISAVTGTLVDVIHAIENQDLDSQ
jgi:hypothetical protein